MLSLDKDAEMLCDFGLTPNQAKVYLAIVQLSIASVGKIAKVSKVRREDVYRILPKLEQMGLIERILGTPAKIRATPLDDALSILIKHEKDNAEKKISTLMTKKDELLKHVKANNKKPRFEEEETQFALLSTRDAILNRLITSIRKAEREINMVTSADEFYHFLPVVAEPLEKAVKKRVKVRVVLEVKGDEYSPLKEIANYLSPRAPLDIKCAYQSLIHYVIVDYAQALIATSPEPPLGEHPNLWTANKSFVGLMQENFEELWHSSVNPETIETNSVSEKIMSTVERLKPTDHVIFVYKSKEAKHDVLFNYLKVGLEKGEAGVYVASDESSTDIRDAMREFGLAVEKHEKTGSLRILGYRDVYMIKGKFDVSATLDIWNMLYREALAKGFKGMRVTGEMACFFKHELVKELVEYEKALHRVLDIPMIAICAYNADDLSKAYNPINLYNELVRAHGTVLFAGIDNKLGKIEIRKA